MEDLESFKHELNMYQIKMAGHRLKISGSQCKNHIIPASNAAQSLKALTAYAPNGVGTLDPNEVMTISVAGKSETIQFPAHMITEIAGIISKFGFAQTEECIPNTDQGEAKLPDIMFHSNDKIHKSAPSWIQENPDFKDVIAIEDGLFVLRFCPIKMHKKLKHVVEGECATTKPRNWGYEVIIGNDEHVGWIVLSQHDEFWVSGFPDRKPTAHKTFLSATMRTLTYVKSIFESRDKSGT